MPTEVYQFYIAPGSSSVSITAAMFGVGGVTLDIETTTQAGFGATALVPGTGFAVNFNSDFASTSRFGNQLILKGEWTQSATAEAQYRRRTTFGNDFAAESHPIMQLDQPNVLTTATDFDLGIYTYHGSGIYDVEVIADGGTAASATLSTSRHNNLYGGKYTIPISSENFTPGTTAEIRVTSKPKNGYDRTMLMKLTYATGENKYAIGLTQGISAGVALVNATWDDTKRNIVELSQTGNYLVGVGDNTIRGYGYVEVLPAAGVSAQIDLSYDSGNDGVRPQMNQMSWKNISFKQHIQEEDPDAYGSGNGGMYLEDAVYTTRYIFEGCTFEQNWITGSTQGIPYLFLDGSTYRADGAKPGTHNMVRYSYYQNLWYIDCWADQMQYSYSAALLCKNCMSYRCYQDSYTNVKFVLDSQSLLKYTPGVALGPDGVGATFQESTLGRHADHWQTFRSGSTLTGGPGGTNVVFRNNRGLTYSELAAMNMALVGYTGQDFPLYAQQFGFFGSNGREQYIDYALVNGYWYGSTGGGASQIDQIYDNIYLIGLTSDSGPLIFDGDPGDPLASEQQTGPVAVHNIKFTSISNSFISPLDNVPGSTNEFRQSGPILPAIDFTGAAQSDARLNTYYIIHVPGASMTGVTYGASSYFALNGDSSGANIYLGQTAQAGPSAPAGATFIPIVFGGPADYDTNTRISYSNTVGETFSGWVFSTPGSSVDAQNFINTGGSAGWWMKVTTKDGYVYNSLPAEPRNTDSGVIDFKFYNVGALGGMTGLTLGGLTGGFTMEIQRT